MFAWLHSEKSEPRVSVGEGDLQGQGNPWGQASLNGPHGGIVTFGGSSGIPLLVGPSKQSNEPRDKVRMDPAAAVTWGQEPSGVVHSCEDNQGRVEGGRCGRW